MPDRKQKNTPDQSERGRAAAGARSARSAEALRENLKRRKQQARDRVGQGRSEHDDEGDGREPDS